MSSYRTLQHLVVKKRGSSYLFFFINFNNLQRTAFSCLSERFLTSYRNDMSFAERFLTVIPKRQRGIYRIECKEFSFFINIHQQICDNESMKIDSGLSKKPLWLKPSSSTQKSSETGAAAKKSIGDTPPIVVDINDYPDLAPLFAYYGSLQRKRRKLKKFSGKDATLKLAKNTVACADDQDNVYLGVDFLRDFAHDDVLIASVMAHEWGHLISQKQKENVDHLTWEEIYQIRREEEAAADCFCGRMIALMGYPTKPIADFINKAKKSSTSLKYYAADIRISIIEEAFRLHENRNQVSRKIFTKEIYKNPHLSRIIHAEDADD